MTTIDAGDVREEFVARLMTLRFGKVSVESVDVTDEWGVEDYPAIRLVLRLSDPDGETWDVDDIRGLDRQINSIAAVMRGLPEVRTLLTGGPPLEDVPIPGEDTLAPERAPGKSTRPNSWSWLRTWSGMWSPDVLGLSACAGESRLRTMPSFTSFRATPPCCCWAPTTQL